ncbi:MAG: NAD(P)H-dependent oxidoreductase [Arenicellales bacterium]
MNGPEGLLKGKRADIIITTGGVLLESPVEFVGGYLKQVFGFIGIDDINILEADQMNLDAETSFTQALLKIEQKYQATAAQEQANEHT